MTQENATPEPDIDTRLYEVGSILKFVAYNPEEMIDFDEELEAEAPHTQPGYKFKAGDLLRVAFRNGCGMGIDVIRVGDGLPNMVWPEEVEVAT